MIDGAQLRLATTDDESTIVALWRQCDLTRPWNDPNADFALAMRTDTSTIIVAVAGEKTVGSVMVGFDGHRGWLYYLAVAPDQRRKGLATDLISRATEWLSALGCPKVELMVRDDNSGAARLYETLGWQRQPVSVYGHWLSQEKD
jgi:ribosomal protein S18 acetylase RimI-like enzyme